MRKLNDLTGERFGKLTVIRREGTYFAPVKYSSTRKNSNPTWLCKCDCGNYTVVLGRNLTHGGTQSCGCLRKERRKLA